MAEKEKMQAYILKHFSYKDGKVSRNDRKGGLGSYDKDGYLILKIKGKQFKYHHVVWLLNNGSFPNGEIDHINRVRDDNRIENLRIADRKTQCNNRTLKPNAVTGVIGVYMDTTKGLKKKYAFAHEGKTYRYYTLELAIKAIKEMKGEKYGEPCVL